MFINNINSKQSQLLCDEKMFIEQLCFFDTAAITSKIHFFLLGGGGGAEVNIF